MGAAWADIAVGTDTAHQLTVCSGKGTCNTKTGQCACLPGFDGAACNRSTCGVQRIAICTPPPFTHLGSVVPPPPPIAVRCPESCGTHGQCLSMAQHAARLDKGLQPRPYYTYSGVWDADMTYGCSCDAGYSGWQCGERVCPAGDDPLTTGQEDEVQLIRCDASGSSVVAAFTISFRGAVTRPFAPSVTPAGLQVLLEELPTIGSVEVTYTRGVTFCSDEFSPTAPASGNVVAVRFLTEHGDLPALVVLDAAGADLAGLASNQVTVAVDGDSLAFSTAAGSDMRTAVTGSKENVACSGRGACDRVGGTCACFAGYGSSNGAGSAGKRGDCGYAMTPITRCPGTVECSGHGTCSAFPEYTCACYEGWGGGDCGERTCPTAPAWFDYPSATGVAHADAECAARGRCNRRTGECQCERGFEGAACERMACPTADAGAGVCSGHGRCLAMQELAAAARTNGDPTPWTYGNDPNVPATWDRRSVYGCMCDTDFTGVDCSQRACPWGTDITQTEWNAALTNEVQSLTCVLVANVGSPTFKLRFRGDTTAALAPTTTASALAAALTALPALAGGVSVLYDGANTAACSAGAGTTLSVSFSSVGGDVPPLQVVLDPASLQSDGSYNTGAGWLATQLQWSGGDVASDYTTALTYIKGPTTGFPATGMRALEVTKGTTTYAECSGRGLCTGATGQCECFAGFTSSNGRRQAGDREDCGWREPLQYLRAPAWPR